MPTTLCPWRAATNHPKWAKAFVAPFRDSPLARALAAILASNQQANYKA
jgi:hypothetical protein